ncbi:hypothetical protein INR49_032788, partial [Caranx melampygus]
MFVCLGDGPDPLFPAMDLNGDKEVPLEEVKRAESSAARVRRHTIIKGMFTTRTGNGDGKI